MKTNNYFDRVANGELPASPGPSRLGWQPKVLQRRSLTKTDIRLAPGGPSCVPPSRVWRAWARFVREHAHQGWMRLPGKFPRYVVTQLRARVSTRHRAYFLVEGRPLLGTGAGGKPRPTGLWAIYGLWDQDAYLALAKTPTWGVPNRPDALHPLVAALDLMLSRRRWKSTYQQRQGRWRKKHDPGAFKRTIQGVRMEMRKEAKR